MKLGRQETSGILFYTKEHIFSDFSNFFKKCEILE